MFNEIISASFGMILFLIIMLIENVLLAKVSESCHRGETEIPDTKLVIEVTLR